MKDIFIKILEYSFNDSIYYIYKNWFYSIGMSLLFLYLFFLLFPIQKIFKDIEYKYHVHIKGNKRSSSEFCLAHYITHCYFKKSQLDYRLYDLIVEKKVVQIREPKKPYFYGYTKYKHYLRSLKEYYKEIDRLFELSNQEEYNYDQYIFNYDINSESKVNIFVCVTFYCGLILFFSLISLPFLLFLTINFIKFLF